MSSFDAEAKEAALRAESEAWDTSAAVDAEPGDIPVIDISAFRDSGDLVARAEVVSQLRHACETVGFWQLVGHGIGADAIADAFSAVRMFHDLPESAKEPIRMDRPDWPLGGVGYLPVGNRKLPARATGNENAAFIVKGDRDLTVADNQWPDSETVPGFQESVMAFAYTLEQLTLDLLPIYAQALELETNWFADAFQHPFWRLRLTRYPANGERSSRSELERSRGSRPEVSRSYGIHPHVDTTFFTLLLQDSPGLTIYHTPKDQWINVPLVEDAFVVNSGELLRQWTNDRFLSVRHYANAGLAERHSIPFFVNATRDYVMECIPTCCDDENPPKYPPISYDQSQGVVQGE